LWEAPLIEHLDGALHSFFSLRKEEFFVTVKRMFSGLREFFFCDAPDDLIIDAKIEMNVNFDFDALRSLQ